MQTYCKILQFNNIISSSPVNNDSKINIFFFRIKYNIKSAIGNLLNRIKFPAFIQKTEIEDPVLNMNIKIKPCSRSTIISIDNRDFYFDRLTGKFTGTGCSMCG